MIRNTIQKPLNFSFKDTMGMNEELEAVAEDKFGGGWGASIELDNFGLSKFSTHNNNTIDFPMSRHICLMIKILKILFLGSCPKMRLIFQS